MHIRPGLCIAVLGLVVPLYWWYGYLGCLNNECHAHVILSGSMEPVLPTGSLIIVRRERPSDYQEGDVVSLIYPERGGKVVTHRIRRVFRYASGVWGVETKGDANTNGDALATSLGAIVGRQVAMVPWVGYAVSILHTGIGLVGVYVLAISVVALSFVFRLYSYRQDPLDKQ